MSHLAHLLYLCLLIASKLPLI